MVEKEWKRVDASVAFKWGFTVVSDEAYDVVSECDVCQRQEVGSRKENVEIVTPKSNWNVGDEVSMDLITEIPITRLGNRHFLQIIEAFSGNAEVYALKTKTAKEFAACFLPKPALTFPLRGHPLPSLPGPPGVPVNHANSLVITFPDPNFTLTN